MRFVTQAAIGLVASFLGSSLAAPIVIVHPGNAKSIIITEENTVNATTPAPGHPPNVSQAWTASGQLPLALVNNFPGGAINAYVSGLNANNQLVMLQANGAFYYPTTSASDNGVPQPITQDVAIPLGGQGSTTSITIPDYISSGRIWFAAGNLEFFTVYNSATGAPSLVEPSAVNPSDPSAGINWGFVELTNTAAGGLYADISYVDFVGLPLGITLECGDGPTQSAKGLQANAVSDICSALQAQGNQDGQLWGDLCQADSNGNPLRVLAPSDYISLNNNAFSNYFTDFNNQVFSHYSSNTLTIVTQAAAGDVSCTVSNGQLTCAGDNRGYAQPTAEDVFGCNSGPFAIESGDNAVHYAVVPRLCAAYNRGTLLIQGGNAQPGVSASSYYTSTPSNWYSKLVHQNEVDGKGYAFPYDDVNPDGGVDQAGVVADMQPSLLTVIVGGPLSS